MKEQYYQTMWEPKQENFIDIPAEEAYAPFQAVDASNLTSTESSTTSESLEERVQQTYWLYDRGLVITLPPAATEKISHGVNNGGIPHDELQRLKIIGRDTILKKRYPTAAEGSDYMQSVDIEWREHLFSIGEQTAEHIVAQANNMGKKELAIILFGSVAKGLSKSPEHPDPSNIDIAVIGTFTQEEKDELFDKIRPLRKEKEEEIGNKVGVHIQDVTIFNKNSHNEALNYIASGATTLYDPFNIWKRVEAEALDASGTMKKFKSVTFTRVTNEQGGVFEQKVVNGNETIIYRKVPQNTTVAV